MFNLFKKKEKQVVKEENKNILSKDQIDILIKEIKKRTKTKCINIKPYVGECTITSSKFGGTPYWPMNQEYPTNKNGNDLVLLAQMNLSDITCDLLPNKGLLQFFIDSDDLLSLDGVYKVVYHENIDCISKENIISNIDLKDKENMYYPFYECYPITFEEGIDYITCTEEYYNDYICNLIDELFNIHLDTLLDLNNDEYEQIAESFNSSGHKLFGHPFFTQWDPRGNDEILLFQMDSEFGRENPIHIMWGDSGVCGFFIKEDDLKQLNFNDVLYNWDCY